MILLTLNIFGMLSSCNFFFFGICSSCWNFEVMVQIIVCFNPLSSACWLYHYLFPYSCPLFISVSTSEYKLLSSIRSWSVKREKPGEKISLMTFYLLSVYAINKKIRISFQRLINSWFIIFSRWLLSTIL